VYYAGLDVSMKRTAVCIVDAAGKRVHEAAVNSTPQAVAASLNTVGVQIERVGLEAGVSSAWLARGLLGMGLPVIVIDATHAAAALYYKTGFRNKTDRNDGRGIADLMRVNKFRPGVHPNRRCLFAADLMPHRQGTIDDDHHVPARRVVAVHVHCTRPQRSPDHPAPVRRPVFPSTMPMGGSTALRR
jgi:hypothetical protein